MKRRVLIVDDSLTVRMDLAETFAERGFETQECETLRCARSVLASDLPDVIILDVSLSDGDGIGLLREIRSSPRTATIGVVLLSARIDVEQRLHGLSVGADEYVPKPYAADELLALASSLADQRRGATVLVIDDSLTYRERLRELLESSGYRAVTAETGEDGLRLALSSRPMAMIVDYLLPGIQGDEVIRRVRQDGNLRRTPTLLLTASEDPSDQLRALEAGADTFVRKDQDPEVLLACLNSIVRSASTPAALEESLSAGVTRVAVIGDGAVAKELESEADPQFTTSVMTYQQFESVDSHAQLDCVVLDAKNAPADTVQNAIRKLKVGPELGDTRVIVIGQSDQPQAVVTFMNEGADDYVPLSAGGRVIWARIRAHLRRKQLEDENRTVREHILRNRLIAETQKELARAAAARNQELQQLAEALPAIVWASGVDGKITYFNTRWYEYTGLSPQHSLNSAWFDALHPQDREAAERDFTASMATGNIFRGEYRIRDANGEYRWFLGRALPVRSHGAITRWLGTAIDIQERREAEEALRRSEKIAATGRLAAAIAHEINNPLEAIVNVLYLLPKAIQSNPERAIEYVDIAQQEISRVSHITRQTLAFSREDGEADDIDVCGLVEESVGVYSAKARDAGVTITTDLNCRQHIFGLPGEIRQVIGNLIANALEASSRGQSVTVRVRPSWNWQDGRSGVRVTVHDRGHGIPRDFEPQLFRVFATTKGQKGTGLGLWVTRSIVEKHKGFIRYRSCTADGRSGTTFTVFLPSLPEQTLSTHTDEIRGLFGHLGRELLDT